MRTLSPLYMALGAVITVTATIGGTILVTRGTPGQAGVCLIGGALIGAQFFTSEQRYRRLIRADARITAHLTHIAAAQKTAHREQMRASGELLREVRQLKLGVAKGHDLENQSLHLLEDVLGNIDTTGPHPLDPRRHLRGI